MVDKKLLRVGVIGLGNMGRAHARVYSELLDVELVGIADPRLALDAAMRPPGTRAFLHHRELLALELDAVTIAAPTELHHAVALDCLRAGVSVLIEKPIARTLDEARELAAAADVAQQVVVIGHIERFNPAAVALKERLIGQKLIALRFQRSGPFPERMSQIGVILDTAIHDIDLARWLTGADVERISCIMSSTRAVREDLVEIVMQMAGGVLVRISADWISPDRTRTVEAHTRESRFTADLLRGRLTEVRHAPEPNTFTVTEHFVRRDDSLRQEVEAFLRSVRGQEPPSVSAADGTRNLELALRCVAEGNA